MTSNYKGPHKIVLNRNPVNLGCRGIGLHVNNILQISSGNLVVLAGGDDISAPERTEAVVSCWINAGKPVGLIHSAVETISDKVGLSGQLMHGHVEFARQDVKECVKSGAKGVLGASIAVTRSVFELFGPLPEGTLFEDRTLAFRSLLVGTVLYCPHALVKYRQHGENISGNEMYTDERRWARWIDGISAKYGSFLADYELVTPLNKRDQRVLTEIRQGLRRAECARPLVNGSACQRVRAAVSYSVDFKLSDRIAFVLQRGGLVDTLPYRILSFLWRAKQRFI